MIEDATEKKVRLTEKETSILKFLYRAGDKVVGRDTFLGEVWGYNAGVTTHTLETHVYRLRQKIELNPSNAEILVTEPVWLPLGSLRGLQTPPLEVCFTIGTLESGGALRIAGRRTE